MDAIDALLSRNSANLLCEPGPTPEQLETIFQAGLRACDHGCLRPWKYVVIEGAARDAFGELMVQVKTAIEGEPLEHDVEEKIRSKSQRAPCIIAVAAKVRPHPKIPEVEQLLSAGASAQMMVTAAHALGLGAIWRSGSLMFAPQMREGLGLASQDQLVGFLYVGSYKNVKELPTHNSADFVTHWNTQQSE